MQFCSACGAQTDVDPCPFCGAHPEGARGKAASRTKTGTYQRPHVPGAVADDAPARPDRAKYVFGGVALAALAGIGVYLAAGQGGDAVTAADRSGSQAAGQFTPSNVQPDVASPGSTDESPAADETPSPTTTTLTPGEARQQAIATMETMVAEDRDQNPIRDQWVAQLASKYEGVVDKSQQATPFTAVEILAEIEQARSHPDYGSLVRVVHQGDWGGSTPSGKTMWVTFADIDMGSREAVLEWCESQFPQGGKALLNVCYPRQMHTK